MSGILYLAYFSYWIQKPLGLLSLLDEESTFPNATDLTFANKLKQHLDTNSCFRGERGKAFTVRHYAGEVGSCQISSSMFTSVFLLPFVNFISISLMIRWRMTHRVFWRRTEIYCTWIQFSSLPNANYLYHKRLHLRCLLNRIILNPYHTGLVLLIRRS